MPDGPSRDGLEDFMLANTNCARTRQATKPTMLRIRTQCRDTYDQSGVPGQLRMKDFRNSGRGPWRSEGGFFFVLEFVDAMYVCWYI